jgi:SAM-dependent methyltransferase
MSQTDFNPWYASILACPDCGSEFAQRGKEDLWCTGCEISRSLRPNADFLPKKQKTRLAELPVTFELKPYLARIEFGPPRITYSGRRGWRDSTELLSVLDQTLKLPGNVLDLGCGPNDQAHPITSLGHQNVGVDYSSAAADILADAHALPFRSASFDFVFSYAVMEHLHNPFLAFMEIGRVLKPGGTMCGTVSLGEPFHNSFFHHTVWGLMSVCAANRFEIVRLWACSDTLKGLAEMGRYSRAVKLGLRFLGALDSVPVLTPRKMLWPERDKALDNLHRAASIGFVIRSNAS